MIYRVVKIKVNKTYACVV